MFFIAFKFSVKPRSQMRRILILHSPLLLLRRYDFLLSNVNLRFCEYRKNFLSFFSVFLLDQIPVCHSCIQNELLGFTFCKNGLGMKTTKCCPISNSRFLGTYLATYSIAIEKGFFFFVALINYFCEFGSFNLN